MLGTSRLVAWGLVAGIGLVIAATPTPGAEAIVHGTSGSGQCDLSRMTLVPLREILELDETGMNVLLFAPLGLALGLLPRSRGKASLILAAIALPFVVEGIQLVVTPLGRQCQSADVIDNLTGLVVGLLGGIVIEGYIPRGRRGRSSRPGLKSNPDSTDEAEPASDRTTSEHGLSGDRGRRKRCVGGSRDRSAIDWRSRYSASRRSFAGRTSSR